MGEEVKYDPLYEQVKHHVLVTNYLCVSGIQRAFLIGYNRAARFMEQLIDDGVVEKYDTGLGGIGYRLKK
jgi:DNA segregation ATPase FtsK/SpoIIIE-like protein